MNRDDVRSGRSSFDRRRGCHDRRSRIDTRYAGSTRDGARGRNEAIVHGVHEISVAVIGDFGRGQRKLTASKASSKPAPGCSFTRRVPLPRLFFPFTTVAYVTSGPHRSVPKGSPFSRRRGTDGIPEEPRDRPKIHAFRKCLSRRSAIGEFTSPVELQNKICNVPKHLPSKSPAEDPRARLARGLDQQDRELLSRRA